MPPATFARARRLLDTIPSGFPVPEIALDPDGEVAFDWIRSDRTMLSVSIGTEGDPSYAAGLADGTAYGFVRLGGHVSNRAEGSPQTAVLSRWVISAGFSFTAANTLRASLSSSPERSFRGTEDICVRDCRVARTGPGHRMTMTSTPRSFSSPQPRSAVRTGRRTRRAVARHARSPRPRPRRLVRGR